MGGLGGGGGKVGVLHLLALVSSALIRAGKSATSGADVGTAGCKVKI